MWRGTPRAPATRPGSQPIRRNGDGAGQMALLNAGARLVGKTITDELAFSINGENAHYGTPLNTKAPQRIPGGSSSGSASAVAGGAAPLALGPIPAVPSACRPSAGSTASARPMAAFR